MDSETILLINIIIIAITIWYGKKCTKEIKERKAEKEGQSKEWKSEWKWNEETQLWEHPLSAKTPNSESSYHYTRSELTKETTTPQQTHFHHTDTSFKAPQRPYTKPYDREREELLKKANQVTWEQPFKEEKKSEYQNAYEATPILTKNEFYNYKTLNEAAMRKGYVVWSKVRLADIVKPRNDSQYMSHFGKIKAKHVDFVILDQNMKVKAVIELDDNSHNREDRKKRDEFVDAILKDCGYKIIHTRYITPNILDNI